MRRLRFHGLLLSAMLASPMLASQAMAAPHGDWPCIQPRVEALSLGAFWSGPDLDEALKNWRQKPEVAALVTEIVSRRLPIEEAEKRVTGFAAAHKDDKSLLTLTFAGVFAELDSLRTRIVKGIERFTRNQRALAESINKDRTELSALGATKEKTDPQRARIQELQTKIQWATRLHHERESTLRYVCETPVILEQRVFAIARAVQNEM